MEHIKLFKYLFMYQITICVPAWHNEAEVGNLAYEILMKVVILAKFMAFLSIYIFILWKCLDTIGPSKPSKYLII